MYKAYFDGAYSGKPRRAKYGGVIYWDNERVGETQGVCDPRIHGDICNEPTSSNFAEMFAISQVMALLLQVGAKSQETAIYGDSMLVVRVLNGDWAVRKKQSPYARLLPTIVEQMNQFENLRIQWIPRSLNFEADALAGFERKPIELIELKEDDLCREFYKVIGRN